jgi:hypothetical protein
MDHHKRAASPQKERQAAGAPTITPPKYRHALERSGNPKDTDEIMVESAK